MKTHIVGRESAILKEIKKGRKTVEARLAKSKFKAFRVGDKVNLREDIWQGSQIIESRLTDVYTEIINIEKYPTFNQMLKNVGYKKVVPWARNLKEATDTCLKFYSKHEEQKFGVLAIYFKLI